MTEEDAVTLLATMVPRETLSTLDVFKNLIVEHSGRQNLISPATLDQIWSRHILDSVQVARLDQGVDRWIDIGSGAGLPGMVAAIIHDRPVLLVEPRALRVGFLETCIATMGLGDRVQVVKKKVQSVIAEAGVISARAVAGLSALYDMAEHIATPTTRWILPRGRSASQDVAEAAGLWHAESDLIPSITDPAAAIVVARSVRRRHAR